MTRLPKDAYPGVPREELDRPRTRENMDNVTKHFVHMAHDDAATALRILEDAAMRGTRAKPTVAELNEVLAKLQNIVKFTGAVIKRDEIKE